MELLYYLTIEFLKLLESIRPNSINTISRNKINLWQ